VDIDPILAKIESLKDLVRNQLETKISLSRVAALKHSKSKHKKQRVTDSFQMTPNHYTLWVMTQIMIIIHLLTQAGRENQLSIM